MLFRDEDGKNDQEVQERALVNEFSGPILFDYVWWILTQAQIRKIKTLYFLARDGYLLREIAQKFCEKYGFLIDCRYLYCSRASLRMPSYHLIGEEAMDLLLQRGYKVTVNSLMQRAELTDAQFCAVLQECRLLDVDREAVLSKKKFEQVASRIRQSQIFRRLIIEKSELCYADTIGYLRQEGMLDQSVVAIVDSGWTGSMQRSLRQLLTSAGFEGEILGFYYGMYNSPKSASDGTYLTWLFNARAGIREKIMFCNNLFECLLSAPHGMTSGYRFEKGGYVPEFISVPSAAQTRMIGRQINMVLEYTEYRLDSISFEEFCEKTLKKESMKCIQRYMAHPADKEVDIYGQFLFCDDVTEAYHFRLADEKQIVTLKEYSIPKRICRKILRSSRACAELFWPYGTIAYLPRWKQIWYRWNVYGWELAKYVLQRK